jgi:hypothetical protein
MSASFDGNLRGSRLGMVSYENDGNVDFAARQPVRFNCPNGHVFSLPFALEAEIPDTWECRCGAEALREDAVWPEKAPAKTGRSHWDMVMERRTVADLEELFLERLALVYENRGATVPEHLIAQVKANPPTVANATLESPAVREAVTRSA